METGGHFERHMGDPEKLAVTIDVLPERFGFVESAGLVELRQRIGEAPADEEAIRELVGMYAAEGARLVEQRKAVEFVRAQLGLAIALALVKRDAGFASYPESLYEAYLYADNLGYDEEAAIIRDTLDQLEE